MRFWPVLLLLVACSSGGKDWRRAKKTGTADAYRAIANDLQHKKRAKAAIMAEKLDWRDAETADSSRGWKAYVNHNPNSSRADEARKRRGEALWREVRTADSRTTYTSWLALNGASPHAQEARERIDELAWEEARDAGDPEGFARYMVRYPNGPHVAEARRLREQAVWDRTVLEDTPAAYRAFQKRFPEGEKADEVKAVLGGFRFSGVAVRVISRKLVREDSGATYPPQLERTLMDGLKSMGFEVHWLKTVDARDADGLFNPLANLLTTVPEDHAALVVEVEETRGDPFEPSGFATDIRATVHLVPPARMEAMDVQQVEATTGEDLYEPGVEALHLSAQRALGRAILQADFGFEEWRR